MHTSLNPKLRLSVNVLFYLAVSSSDHVYVVANHFEREASVHQSNATLQRETDHLTQMQKLFGTVVNRSNFHLQNETC